MNLELDCHMNHKLITSWLDPMDISEIQSQSIFLREVRFLAHAASFALQFPCSVLRNETTRVHLCLASYTTQLVGKMLHN